MRRFTIMGLMLFLMACTYERADWDSGSRAKQSFMEEQREARAESTRNQLKVDERSDGASWAR